MDKIMVNDDDQEKLRKILSIFPQRIAELDRQNAELEKKRSDQIIRDAEILFKQKQAELSQLFLLDNLSIFQAAQLLAWSNEIAHYQLNGNFHEIDKILTGHFEKIKLALPVVEEAVLCGALECQIHRTSTADLSIDRNSSTITKSAMRKWLITKPGYFSSGFFPEINSAEDWEPIRQRMLSEQEACGTDCLVVEEPPLITLKRATEEGQLDKYHLLWMAVRGQDILELLIAVDYNDIVGGVAMQSKAREPSYYLALPSFDANRLIIHGDAYVDSFLLPKSYLPPCAGLVLLQQLVTQSADSTIKTREPYHIRIDQEKLLVVRGQAKRFFKKHLEKTPLPSTQAPPVSSNPKMINGAEDEDPDLIKPTASPIGKKDKKRVLTNAAIKAFPVGGAPKAAITEVVEWAYNKLAKNGNTEIIKRGKIKAFLQYLKECITEGNSNYSDYVAKRIIEIRAVDSACKITMQDLTSKEKLRMLNTGKHTIINKNRVSTILSELRKNKKS
jgi:hypothetical protein